MDKSIKSQSSAPVVNFSLGSQPKAAFSNYSTSKFQESQHDFESLPPESLMWDSFSEPSTYLVQKDPSFQSVCEDIEDQINSGLVCSVGRKSDEEDKDEEAIDWKSSELPKVAPLQLASQSSPDEVQATSAIGSPCVLQSPTAILEDKIDPYNQLESLLDPLMEAHNIRYSLPPRERRKLKSNAKFKHKRSKDK